MQTILKTIRRIILPLALLGSMLVPAVALAQACPDGSPAPNGDPAQCAAAPTDTKSQVCEGVGLTSGGSGCSNPAGSPSVESAIRTVINFLSILVGVAAVIMIIVGGLKYILSSGDSNSTNSAKNTILYALVGLVVAALAQVMVRFVLNRVQPACPTAGQTQQADGSCK